MTHRLPAIRYSATYARKKIELPRNSLHEAEFGNSVGDNMGMLVTPDDDINDINFDGLFVSGNDDSPHSKLLEQLKSYY